MGSASSETVQLSMLTFLQDYFSSDVRVKWRNSISVTFYTIQIIFRRKKGKQKAINTNEYNTCPAISGNPII